MFVSLCNQIVILSFASRKPFENLNGRFQRVLIPKKNNNKHSGKENLFL